MLNKQIPMKALISDGDTLLVHSIFPTIQGEGIFAGKPCVFVRLGGCNLQCPACDTEYSEGAKLLHIHAIMDTVLECSPSKLIIITGGEPFRQVLGKFIRLANSLGYAVQLETNGTLFDETIDFGTGQVFVMCSPKTGAVNKKLQPYISAYKYVGGCNEVEVVGEFIPKELRCIKLEDHGLMEDGLPRQALGHTAKPHLARPHAGFKGTVYLQPIDRQNEGLNWYHQKAVVNSCLQNGYTLCLQIHKIIDVA